MDITKYILEWLLNEWDLNKQIQVIVSSNKGYFWNFDINLFAVKINQVNMRENLFERESCKCLIFYELILFLGVDMVKMAMKKVSLFVIFFFLKN